MRMPPSEHSVGAGDKTSSGDGWRAPLWSDFVDNNMLINMVGDQNDGPTTLLDTANAGYPGLTASEIAARLPALLQDYQPQAILLMTGTNDANQGVAPATIANDILGMLETVQSMSPSTHEGHELPAASFQLVPSE